MWAAVTALVAEIKACEKAGATISGVAMAYVCIDTMAFLSLPVGQESQEGADFISWVDTYMKGHAKQPYQYRGVDVYGARCAVLHAFSAEAAFHQRYPDAKKFVYHNGGEHVYDPAVNDHLVIIGTASLLNDVVLAVDAFLEQCKSNADLRQRVEARLPRVLATLPYPAE